MAAWLGALPEDDGADSVTVDCPFCAGRGTVGAWPCESCRGCGEQTVPAEWLGRTIAAQSTLGVPYGGGDE
jgi:DnaJ-class molecular chaperone